MSNNLLVDRDKLEMILKTVLVEGMVEQVIEDITVKIEERMEFEDADIGYIYGILTMNFPELHISLRHDPDDDETLFAYMFNVSDECETEYKERAKDLIKNEIEGLFNYRVIPSIKTESVTAEHYPKYQKLKTKLEELCKTK